ncbi:MAG TPA: prenyltransferase [Kofleriaceae bacterium]|nr:prenyltransferase [Kofleriaceae bacterium]
MTTQARAAIPLTPASRRDFWRGVWRVADPKITLASVAAMLLGAAMAATAGPVHWGWLVLTVVGIFCVEAAKNASGEIFDWDSGADQAVGEADRSPFSGGKRVLVDRLMSRRQAAAVAAVFYALGGLAGLVIALAREPAVLWLGLAGASLAFFYHAPPFKLSYRGLGELAVALSYGPLITCGTYLVQQHRIDAPVVLLSLPLGLLIAGFLWVNEFPDRRADAGAGKRTLVVRLGARRAARAFAALVAAAYLGLTLLPLAGLPLGVLGGLAGLPHGVAAARRLARDPETTSWIIPAQAWTLLSFLLLAVGAAAGLTAGALMR